VVNPENHHSRFRLNEVKVDRATQSFFQWWNFLIFDGETLDHFTIAFTYLTSKSNSSVHPPSSKLPFPHGQDDAVSSALFYRRGPQTRFSAASFASLDRVEFATPFSFKVYNKTHPDQLQHVIDTPEERKYRIVGHLSLKSPPSAFEDGASPIVATSWNLLIHSEAGHYGALDQESAQCLLTSTLFGYHSTAEGIITAIRADGSVSEFHINRSKRFRVYAAGSWGCMLPTGPEPINYPWTWLWLIIPAEQREDDIGFVAGTARLSTAVGAVHGGYSSVNYPGSLVKRNTRHEHFSMRYLRLFDGTPLQFLLSASTSEGHFSNFSVTQNNWQTFRDAHGEAVLPLQQTFEFSSEFLHFMLDFHPTLNQYFRLAVPRDEMIFSDFRAVGVKTHIVIRSKVDQGEVLLDRWVDTMNAVEYAYVAPFDRSVAFSRLSD